MASQSVIPELLCLKYQGICTPWEIAAGAKGFVYKMRKYSRWNEVHHDAQSRDILLAVAEELESEAAFSIHYFGAVSLVWERVQRWRKDKKAFSLEPDLTVEFERFALLLAQGANTPSYAVGVIADWLDVSQIPTDLLWKTFLAVCSVELVAARKSLPEDLRALCDHAKQQTECRALLAAADAISAALYDQLGYILEPDQVGDKVLTLVEDCGLAITPTVTIVPPTAQTAVRPKWWVEYASRSDSRLIGAKFINNQVVVQINADHPGLQGAGGAGLRTDDIMWQALGAALVSHLGEIDALQDFFDSWGAHLKRATLARQRAGSTVQVTEGTT